MIVSLPASMQATAITSIFFSPSEMALAIATSSMSVTREGAQNSMPLIGEVIEFINS